MLIASHRHSEKDLSLWREYEFADRIHGKRPALQRKIDRSLNAIREFISRGPCYCGVSWGKDSVVVAHLVRSIDESIPLVHLRPSNHNPDCELVRDAFAPAEPYCEIAIDYSHIDRTLSDLEQDRLSDIEWRAGWRTAVSMFGDHYLSGVRADESKARKLRCARWGESSLNACAPLAWWTTQDVFGYLAANNLPVHPAYACLGGGRWPRERIRTAEIGDTHGKGGGRGEWEMEYYGDTLRRSKTPQGAIKG